MSGLYAICIVYDKQRLDYEGACMVSENIFNSSMLGENCFVTIWFSL